jgi:hypothetical protein
MFDELPEWLRGPVAAVLHDLQPPRPVDLRLAYEERADGEGVLWIGELDDPFWTGVGVTPWRDEPVTRLVVGLADWLQEQFFPESRGAWGEARPACPGHPHPAQADELSGEAWWICPADGRRIGRIGSLA